MIQKAIRETIQKYDMIRPGQRVLIGFSGGADSLCLLVNLHELSESMGFTAEAVHVHHMLRHEAADRDAAFTEAFCRERGIPYTLVRVDVKTRANAFNESTEEAARNLRYEALFRILQEHGSDRIALAHHQNDLAETVLFHMIRGSGLKGLSGIPPVRGPVIRPLLFVSRRDILLDLKERGLSYCTDETNDSDDASRNVIRHYVMPALREIRRDADAKISGTGNYLSEVDRYLTEKARELLQGGASSDADGIGAGLLCAEDPVMQDYLVSVYLRDHGFSMKDITREHLRQAARLSAMGVGKKTDLPGGVFAVRTYTGVAFRKKEDAGREEAGEKNGCFLRCRVFDRPKGRTFPEKEYTKWLDYDKIKGTPVLRTRRPKDRISVRAGEHKKLKDWMIDEKIPQEMRGSILLAADGSEILWVVGYRLGADYRVTDATTRIMEISIEKEGETGDEG